MAFRDPYERTSVISAMAELAIAQSHKQRLSRAHTRRELREADHYRLARQELKQALREGV